MAGVSRGLLTPTISGSFQGTAQVLQSSQQGLETLLSLAILVIYLVLGILYESYVHPVTILTALPFTGGSARCSLSKRSTSTSTCTLSSASSCSSCW